MSITRKNNVITLEFGKALTLKTEPIFQYDTGIIVKFKDIPDGVDVQLNNILSNETINKMVLDGKIQIPSDLTTKPYQISAYIQYVNANSQYIEKYFSIPVIARHKPADYVKPDDEQTFREFVEERFNELEQESVSEEELQQALEDYVPKTRKIADMSLDDDISTTDLSTAIIDDIIENPSVTERFNELIEDGIENSETVQSKASQTELDEVRDIAMGAQKAISYTSYRTMINDVNDLPPNSMTIGQSVFIVTKDVPDLWVMAETSTYKEYEYTTDEDIVYVLERDGYIQIGYYLLAMAEAKVDLTNYAKKEDVYNVGVKTNVKEYDYNVDSEHAIQPFDTGAKTDRIDISVVERGDGVVRFQYTYNNIETNGNVTETIEFDISESLNTLSIEKRGISSLYLLTTLEHGRINLAYETYVETNTNIATVDDILNYAKIVCSTVFVGSGNPTGSTGVSDGIKYGDLYMDTINRKIWTPAIIATNQQGVPVNVIKWSKFVFDEDLSSVAKSGSYNDLTNKPSIPSELADLSDDTTHRTVTDTEKTNWNSKADGTTFDTELFDWTIINNNNYPNGWRPGYYDSNGTTVANSNYLRTFNRFQTEADKIVFTPPTGHRGSVVTFNTSGYVSQTDWSNNPTEITVRSGERYYFQLADFNNDSESYINNSTFIKTIKCETKTEKNTVDKLNDFVEKNKKALFSSMSMYTDWTVCGASRDCGYMFPVQNGTPVTNRSLAWGNLVAKKFDNNCSILAYTGATSMSWLTDNDYGLPKLLSEPAKELYVLSFGYNEASKTENDFGTISNAHTDLAEFTNADKQTMYGAYSFIVASIKDKAPNALIIGLFRYTDNPEYQNVYNARYLQAWNCVKDIANLFGYPTINWCDSEIHNEYILPSTYRYNGHPTAQGYSLMANVWEDLYSECVLNNWEYFSHFVTTNINKRVFDVQINGTSIVSNGVANIPVAYGILGAVKITNNVYGLKIGQSLGELQISLAQNSDIDARALNTTTKNYKPIVPANLDYAVKRAMTDGLGTSWTGAERTSARERMGIVTLTQAEYDLLVPDENTIYIIVEDTV